MLFLENSFFSCVFAFFLVISWSLLEVFFAVFRCFFDPFLPELRSLRFLLLLERCFRVASDG